MYTHKQYCDCGIECAAGLFTLVYYLPVCHGLRCAMSLQELGRGQQHFVSPGGKLNETVPLFVPTHKEKLKVSFPSRTDIVS